MDKEQKLRNQNLLTEWHGFPVLDGACGYLLLKKQNRMNIGGDHELFYFLVEKSSTKSESGVLMFQKLIDEGVIL